MSDTIDRRQFLKAGAAASLGAAGTLARAAENPSTKPDGKFIWANLLHLSYSMWWDWPHPKVKALHGLYKPYLRFDEKLWNDLLAQMVDAGMNMVIIDLGDGVKYESHPEIAIKNAWSIAKLKDELTKLRQMGLEPIPKLNFSTNHDLWLGVYARQVSTEPYYTVCKDLIAEVIELFDKPRFFHLGMDEETIDNHKYHEYVVLRQYDLWWRDFLFLVGEVEKSGSRSWIWSDYVWHHPEEFYEKMPKSVLQSNWYYYTEFDESKPAVKAYTELEQAGYDQVPTGSNYNYAENFGMLVDYCVKRIDRKRLLGFMQTPWQPTVEVCRKHHMIAIAEVKKTIEKFNAQT